MALTTRDLVLLVSMATVVGADSAPAPEKEPGPSKADRKSVAERIAKDEKLLKIGFAIMRTMLLEGITKPKGALGRAVGGIALDEPRPTLATIAAKYGNHDRVSDFPKVGMIDRESIVYWYGPLGLVVPKGSTDQQIRWVVVE